MARNKTQPKIEGFIQALSLICNHYGMVVDTNGGGKPGDHGTSRFLEGAPLVLFTKSGSDYRKVGYLWYSFDDTERPVYHFEPKSGSPYRTVNPTIDNELVVALEKIFNAA